MGKSRARKTRWRTLPIADEQSDSEESNTNSTHRFPKSYQQKAYLSKNFSSQSIPRRKYYDSTRSSSTTSETKITFNEDEYTRITTPRQDVLFKKGYLSKPKTYQTQTSTGNSTTSTGNSTGNGTPDYQSTDLEYESQFVFPNGFVDQNGIYYVNSYEPYPVMVYNPQTYYPEFTNIKSKRYSTGSLTESVSPNNEEVSSQDQSQSGGDNLPDFPVYNMVYPYYVNGVCPPQEIEGGHPRLKKRRRRKTSKTVVQDDDSTSEYTDQESEAEDKALTLPKPAQSLSNSSTCTSPNSELSKTDNENVRLEDFDNNDCDRLSGTKYDLKPDAEEFVPRAYRAPEYHLPPGLQYIKLPPHIVPMHIMPTPAFIPPNFPVNYGYVPQFVGKPEEEATVLEVQEEEEHKDIDMNQIVSKLEEAAKEQQQEEVPKIQKQYRNNRYNRGQERKFRRDVKQESPKKERTPKRVNRYAEVVKQQSPRQSPVEVKVVEKKVQSPEKPKLPNQWIPVASKKKRKNKNVEETEDFVEVECEVDDSGLFESYDVSLLVDVVPQEVKEEQLEVVEEAQVQVVEEKQHVEEEQQEIVQVTPEPQVQEEVLSVDKPKKKSKKGTQKPLTKRVIITDVDLSETTEETKAKIVEVPEETPKVQPPPPEKPTSVKKKKKKNKIVKAPMEEPTSNPTNTTEVSYDFLLDTSSVEENLEKTNIEVYQELDKIIQKGMYSSLEVKMKSMNIEKDDEFFKDVISNISSKELNVEKGSFAQTPDFTKILQSTRKLYTNPTGFYPLRQMDLF